MPEPVKKCQEKIIVPYVIFSFFFAIFSQYLSQIAHLDVRVATTAL